MAKETACCCCGEFLKAKPWRAVFIGILMFLIGLLIYLGYGWDVILMAVGVLFILKGIVLKMKKK
jgi:uncharacterized membrane protein HdeD (DUF308 family)